jgi:polysaccharide export outer membrane protein
MFINMIMKPTGMTLSVLLILLFSSSCSKPIVKNPTPLGAPGTEVTYPAPEYRIQVGDQLDIKFFYNPELNESVVVRPDGRISLQLINEVMATGRTPAELNEELKEKYSAELANPSVTVIVRSFTSQRVFVDGEVNKPAIIDLVGPTTVLHSITLAGGLKDTARTNEVVIVRRTAEKQVVTIPINLDKITDGTETRQNIELAPYDIVFVPKSAIADAAKWVDLYLRRTILVLPQEFFLYYSLATR